LASTAVLTGTNRSYDSLRFRRLVQERGFRPLIPTPSCIPAEQAVGELSAKDTSLPRKRSIVERTLGWRKGFRRLCYRVDRTAASCHACGSLAILVRWMRRLVRQARRSRGDRSCEHPRRRAIRTHDGQGREQELHPLPAESS
jgi:transposase